jgi:hypothetical protein
VRNATAARLRHQRPAFGPAARPPPKLLGCRPTVTRLDTVRLIGSVHGLAFQLSVDSVSSAKVQAVV